MIELTDETLIRDIEATVRNTPGVTSIFPVGGIMSKMINAGATLLGAQQNEVSPIWWEPAPEGPRVEAAIGVHAAAGAAEISCRVHAEVVALCRDRGYDPVEIRITVVQVDEI